MKRTYLHYTFQYPNNFLVFISIKCVSLINVIQLLCSTNFQNCENRIRRFLMVVGDPKKTLYLHYPKSLLKIFRLCRNSRGNFFAIRAFTQLVFFSKSALLTHRRCDIINRQYILSERKYTYKCYVF